MARAATNGVLTTMATYYQMAKQRMSSSMLDVTLKRRRNGQQQIITMPGADNR